MCRKIIFDGGQMQNKGLYSAILTALGGLVLLSLGEGFWGGGGRAMHWTSELFYGICHRLPERTYRFGGYPMAVNTRCFGIFAGLFTGWIAIPFVTKKRAGSRWTVRIFMVAVMLQIIDYSGNMFLLWENTNHTRALLGIFLGVTSSLLLTSFFQSSTKS